jgi:hypothetical protein
MAQDMPNNKSLVTAITSDIIAGLGPALHHFQERWRRSMDARASQFATWDKGIAVHDAA